MCASGFPTEAGVIQEAYRFNVPMLLFPAAEYAPSRHGTEQSFISIDNPAMVIDTIKKAEDSDALIIRIYEVTIIIIIIRTLMIIWYINIDIILLTHFFFFFFFFFF